MVLTIVTGLKESYEFYASFKRRLYVQKLENICQLALLPTIVATLEPWFSSGLVDKQNLYSWQYQVSAVITKQFNKNKTRIGRTCLLICLFGASSSEL